MSDPKFFPLQWVIFEEKSITGMGRITEAAFFEDLDKWGYRIDFHYEEIEKTKEWNGMWVDEESITKVLKDKTWVQV
jgi:hypothetical protein